eukprot:TRINITY_DN1365_c0_g1_i1.p1 TRINITY_DN1365_c0_g1~~TRINITY_DN1365_c0_g1_i1.p1  ORF type:complete len:223 (-),score=54.72 TRINITY_DN1365_c0_g1_i1:86-754(-)
MFLIKKEVSSGDSVFCPPPTFIIEASPSLLRMLGYKNLDNYFFPDLVPKSHFCRRVDYNSCVQKKNVDFHYKLLVDKVLFLRHSEGHYIHLQSRITIYMDQNNVPSLTTMNVTKIFELRVEEKYLPRGEDIPASIFSCAKIKKAPHFAKKYDYLLENSFIVKDNVPPNKNKKNSQNFSSQVDGINSLLVPPNNDSFYVNDINDPFFFELNNQDNVDVDEFFS